MWRDASRCAPAWSDTTHTYVSVRRCSVYIPKFFGRGIALEMEHKVRQFCHARAGRLARCRTDRVSTTAVLPKEALGLSYEGSCAFRSSLNAKHSAPSCLLNFAFLSLHRYRSLHTCLRMCGEGLTFGGYTSGVTAVVRSRGLL